MRLTPKKILSNQKNLLIATGSLTLFVVLLITVFTSEDKKFAPTLSKQAMDLPLDNVNLRDAWIARIDSEHKLSEQRLKYLEEIVLETKKRSEAKDHENEKLRQELHRLKQELHASSALDNIKKKEYSKSVEKDVFSSISDYRDSQELAFDSVLQEAVMSFSRREKVNHVDKAIPAGTTVKALLVSSVDAPCGVYAPNDPQPIKLRILDDASLPKKVRVLLKGGIIIASAFGNISSERLNVRIERITQVKPNGDFVETNVAGYVTGEDGKYGIRGIVVDRSDQLIQSAAFSGFFSGVSQFIQTTTNAQAIQKATDGLPTDIKWDLLKQGSLQGSTNALEKLSEYYIKRAEQIQPVIQVAAGRIVDITFTHGAEIGDLHTQDKVKKLRESSR